MFDLTLEQYNVVLKYAAIASWVLVLGWTAYQVHLSKKYGR